MKIGYCPINAKAETVADKPSFREAFKRAAKRKQPYAIVMKDRDAFGFAGLWEQRKDKMNGETVQSCTIITTEPNAMDATRGRFLASRRTG